MPWSDRKGWKIKDFNRYISQISDHINLFHMCDVQLRSVKQTSLQHIRRKLLSLDYQKKYQGSVDKDRFTCDNLGLNSPRRWITQTWLFKSLEMLIFLSQGRQRTKRSLKGTEMLVSARFLFLRRICNLLLAHFNLVDFLFRQKQISLQLYGNRSLEVLRVCKSDILEPPLR